jgi:hypothetical protein
MMGPSFALQVRLQSIQTAWPASCALSAETARPQFRLVSFRLKKRNASEAVIVSVVRQESMKQILLGRVSRCLAREGTSSW